MPERPREPVIGLGSFFCLQGTESQLGCASCDGKLFIHDANLLLYLMQYILESQFRSFRKPQIQAIFIAPCAHACMQHEKMLLRLFPSLQCLPKKVRKPPLNLIFIWFFYSLKILPIFVILANCNMKKIMHRKFSSHVELRASVALYYLCACLKTDTIGQKAETVSFKMNVHSS